MNLAYVAGIIDGEGCISFHTCRAWVHPQISVVNTDIQLLKDLQRKFGGDVRLWRRRVADWRPIGNWRVCGSRAVKVLDKVSLYLRIKNRQAHTVFAWDAIRQGSGRRPDPDAIALLKVRMSWLNKRGSQTGEDPCYAVCRKPGNQNRKESKL